MCNKYSPRLSSWTHPAPLHLYPLIIISSTSRNYFRKNYQNPKNPTMKSKDFGKGNCASRLNVKGQGSDAFGLLAKPEDADQG